MYSFPLTFRLVNNKITWAKLLYLMDLLMDVCGTTVWSKEKKIKS